MSNSNLNQIVEDINTISEFLAKRDIDELTSDELYNKFDVKQVDMVIILGNSIPYIAELGADIYKSGLSKSIMIAGGIGHSTKYLVDNILNDARYKDINVKDMPEADILKQLLVRFEEIEEDDIIIENKSTNCGANAIESLKVVKKEAKVPESILLLQDPTMQLRTHASFLKEWRIPTVISYAPFIPKFKVSGNEYEYINNDINSLWSKERFIDLIMGEIPRLRDDENGYGPKGKNFITHVDIQDDVLYSYERLLSYYSEYSEIKNRK